MRFLRKAMLVIWSSLAAFPLVLCTINLAKGTSQTSVILGLLFAGIYAILTLFLFVKGMAKLRSASSALVYAPTLSRRIFWMGPILSIIGFSLCSWIYCLNSRNDDEKLGIISSLIAASVALIYNTIPLILCYPIYFPLCIANYRRERNIANAVAIICFAIMFSHALGFTLFETQLAQICNKDETRSFSSTSGITTIYLLGCFVFWVRDSCKTPNDIFYSSLHPFNAIRYNLCKRVTRYCFMMLLSGGVFLPGSIIFITRNSNISTCRVYLGVSYATCVVIVSKCLFCAGMIGYFIRKCRWDIRRYLETVAAQEQNDQDYYETLANGLTSVVYRKMEGNPFAQVLAANELLQVEKSANHVGMDVEEVNNGLSETLLKSEEERCPICWLAFEDGVSLITYVKPCKHIFHDACLRSWIQQKHDSCPNCRAEIEA